MIAEQIKALLAELGYPVANDVYTGTEKEYLVFNYQTIPSNFADDEPQHERVLVQVHLFARHTVSTTKLEKQIKRALFDAGYTWPSRMNATEETRSSTGTTRHIVFECETAESM